MSQPGNCPWFICDLDPTQICRDENCDRSELHEAHEVTTKAKKDRVTTEGRALWKRSAPRALDRCIMKATSRYYATHFGAMLQEVRDDYGSCEERTVYRRVKRLVARGNLIKLDLGLSFAAYVRPKSRLLGDLALIREQLSSQVENNWQYQQ